jgi:hypothetical protein
MKKPTTLELFKDLLASMQHRERFVFKLTDEAGKNEMQTDIEIYTTIIKYEIGRRIQNINYQFVGADGKFDKKWNAKTSQLWHVTSDKWLNDQIYSKLA